MRGRRLKDPEDHADGLAAMPGELERSHAAELAPQDKDGAGRGVIEASEQVQQRRFAGAGSAEKGEELSGRHLERDAVHGANHGAAQGVVAGEVFGADGRAVRGGSALGLCRHCLVIAGSGLGKKGLHSQEWLCHQA